MTSTPLTIDVATIERAISLRFEDWAHSCHRVSIAIIKSGVLPVPGRVARGWAKEVTSQHSWIALGDPYNPSTPLLDPTLWSYRPGVEGVWQGTLQAGIHSPHGNASVWDTGQPIYQGGPGIRLDRSDLSVAAIAFLDLIEPLDYRGWCALMNGGMLEWPASEIVSRAYGDHRIMSAIPIDIVGMLTDHNPGGLYL